jgi:hypothetical protein
MLVMDRDLSSFRPSRLWRRLPLERRLDAADLFWNDEQSADQQLEAVAAIATHMKFRPKSVLGLPPQKRARYLATLPNISDTIAARALVSYHLERQRAMMGAFLDLLGIVHENGLIGDENVARPDADKLKTAARELATKFPPEDVMLYFSTLVAQDPETWEPLVDIVEPQPTA